EVGADLFPAVAAIVALEQELRGHVDELRIVLRREDRRAPVEAESLARLRLRTNVLRLAGARVVAHDAALLRFGVHEVVIERIGHGVETVAAGHAEPIGVRRTEAVARAARTAPRLI